MQNGKKDTRNSSLELLRLISIFGIVLYHYCFDILYTKPMSVDYFITSAIGSWGVAGVGVFFSLSAYFLIDKKQPFRSEKLIEIIAETIFYGILSVVIYWGWSGVLPGKYAILTSVGAPFFDTYWFITAYIMMYCLAPFFNKILDYLSSGILKRFLIVLTVLCFGLKAINYGGPFSGFGLAVYIYFLIGYLKKNPDNFFKRNRKKGIVLTVAAVILLQSGFCLLSGSGEYAYIFSGRYSIFQLVLAVFLFYHFKEDVEIADGEILPILAKGTLGIYCMHENPLTRSIWVNELFCIPSAYGTISFWGRLLFAAVVTVVICEIIDWVRRMVLSPLTRRGVSQLGICNSINEWMNIL